MLNKLLACCACLVWVLQTHERPRGALLVLDRMLTDCLLSCMMLHSCWCLKCSLSRSRHSQQAA